MHLKKPKNIGRREQLEQGARRINRKARGYMRDREISWYVLFVPTQKEYLAQKILSQWFTRRNKMEPDGHLYLPLNVRWRRESRFSRKKRRFSFPIIPGCLLLGLPKEADCWYDLFQLHIIRGVLSVDNRPVCISGKTLEQFIRQNRDDVEIQPRLSSDHPELIGSGDHVKITDGPFAGHMVDIKAINGEKAKVLLDFMGANQEVDIALERLKKIPCRA